MSFYLAVTLLQLLILAVVTGMWIGVALGHALEEDPHDLDV